MSQQDGEAGARERSEKVVVITGARGQVGSAIVRRLSGRAPLALLERAPMDGPQPDSPARVGVFGGVDLAQEAAVRDVIARVRREFGPIGALVHTVGGYAGGVEVLEQPFSTVQRMLEMNFLSAVHVVQAVLPDVIAAGQGRIVLFASSGAFQGRAGSSAYAAAKGALIRFAEALAEEVAPHGVGVRVIAPTTIDTPPNRAAMPKARFADWVTPDEIASTVEFLLDPTSSGIRFAAIPMGR